MTGRTARATRHLLAVLAVIAVAEGVATRTAVAQATAVTLTGTFYSQTFDGMATSGSAALPGGWGITGSNTSPTYATTGTNVTQNAGTAGSTGVVNSTSAGGNYLWVSGTLASGTDKAVGFLTSSGVGGPRSLIFGFTNSMGGTISNLDLGWDYEKYRSGTRQFDWTFFTSTDGSSWTSVTGGNQSYPADANNTTVSNPPASTPKTVSVSGLSIGNGSSFYLRWNYAGLAGSSNAQGLGLDNFALTATLTGAGPTDLYWDGGAGWNATSPGAGGNGSWGDGTGSWDPAVTANFGGTAGTVTSGSVTAGRGMVFSTTGYTLTGGTIALAGASSGLNSITTGTVTTFSTTIDSVLSGTAGLTKAGAGTLVLGGANTFSGNVAVNAGTLQIAADSALGDAANDLALAGTLKTTGSISMGSGRDVTGAGALDIAPGTTLTSSGVFNLSSTTLANGGTLDLQGGTRALGTLTFGTAATVNGGGAISITSLTATAVTSGSAVINPAITFSTTGDKTVDVGSGGALVLAGTVSGLGSGRIAKTGSGTLIASGTNSTNGFRVGATGTSSTFGGTLILGAAAASGTGQLQLNYGTLQVAEPFVLANGLSVGGRANGVAVIGGTNAITVSGSSSFYRATNTSGEMRLDVNNATTLDGVLGATSGPGTVTGVTLGGTGSLTLNGSASAFVDLVTLQDAIDLFVNNTLGGGVTVAASTLLGGSGTISGLVQVQDSGILAPGPIAGPGTLTIANALALSGSSVVAFDLSATDQTVGGGVNDLVAGITSLTLDGVLNVSGIGDFSTVLAGAKWRLFDYSGGLTDQTLTLGSMPTLASGNTFEIDTATLGQVNLIVVPEPGSGAAAGVGIAAVGWWLRRRRRVRPVTPWSRAG